MLIDRNSRTIGSLSGGCLEEEVAECARTVMRSGRPELLEFDTRRRFGCHGAIEIFLERIETKFLRELSSHLALRRPFSVVTLFERDASERGSRVSAFDEARVEGAFTQEVHPQIRLIIFGQGPDSAPLRSFAQILGWDVRECEQASELGSQLDPWTAVVVKSHNYGRDYAALQTLLPLEMRYVGLVGPRARRDQHLGDLLERQVTLEAELFAPAGLDLAAEGPEEIALAIVSEIQTVFSGGTHLSLRNANKPIHAVRPALDLSHSAGFQPVG